MPRGDGTGPMGFGPMSGRGAGFCAGFAAPGYANPVSFGCGFGRGRRLQRRSFATGMPGWAYFGHPAYAGANMEAADEKEILTRQAAFLEKQLQQIEERLSRLEKDDE